MKVILIAILALLGACTTTIIPRDHACHEQADAWCDRAGFAGAPGCRVWYVHECEPSGPDGEVQELAQNQCLDAIADNPDPSVEPSVCVITW